MLNLRFKMRMCMKFINLRTGCCVVFTSVVLISIAAAGFSQEKPYRARKLYDIEEQLTSVRPAGVVKPGYPVTGHIDYYRVDDDVWVSVKPDRMVGEEAWLFVVNAANGTKPKDGEALEDVSGGVERIFIRSQIQSNCHLVWKAPLVEGEYNVVIDFAPLGVYNRGLDIIDDMSTTGVGFRVSYPLVDYLMIEPLDGNNIIDGGCARVQGTGLPQFYEYYKAYVWNNGENGIPEEGGGDDVNLGQVMPSWSTDVPSYLGSIDELGIFESAIDYRCGEGLVFASYEFFKIGEGLITLSDTSTVAVLPPDWVQGDSLIILGR